MENMTEEILGQMYKDHKVLMEDIWRKISPDTPEFYDSLTHAHLIQNAWEILFPVNREKWSERFTDLNYDSAMVWPNHTSYCYISDVLMPPSIPIFFLNFGYAVMEDNSVVKTAFFRTESIVDYQLMPQGVVVDPLTDSLGVKPKYYVGVSVEKEDLQRFLFKKDIRVLEGYVSRKSKEEHEQRLYDSHMESYHTQMTYAPDFLYRNKRVYEFAKENGLHIPESQRLLYEQLI